jgi:alpha-1,6-mannosyltransferase
VRASSEDGSPGPADASAVTGVVVATAGPPPARPGRLGWFVDQCRIHRMSVASAVTGLVGGLILASTVPVWHQVEGRVWRLTLPGLSTSGGPGYSLATFLLGVVLLSIGWLGLVGQAERGPGSPRSRLTVVLVVGAVWAVPMLLGPPMLSSDVYSYAAQGELASKGIDPTSVGPNLLHTGAYLHAQDSLWRSAPNPYGPAGNAVSEFAVIATGHDFPATVWALRLIAVSCVGLLAVAVSMVARAHNRSPALAVAIGVANPVVTVHLVGGAHNDALMAALLVFGIAFAQRGRWVLGILLVALAGSVKVPALGALVYLGWIRAAEDATLRQRLRTVAELLGASAGVIAVLSVLTHTGLGWITALKGTGKLNGTFSISTRAGFVVADLLHLVGVGVSADTVVGIVRFLFLLVGGACCLLILANSHQLGAARATGLALSALILLSPVVWPWYLAAGFALVAATGIGAWRPSLIFLTMVFSGAVLPSNLAGLIDAGAFADLLAFAGLAVVAFVAWKAPTIAAYWHSPWQSTSRPDVAIGSGLTPSLTD